jgi:serine/threonine-protein kinase RsbW
MALAGQAARESADGVSVNRTAARRSGQRDDASAMPSEASVHSAAVPYGDPDPPGGMLQERDSDGSAAAHGEGPATPNGSTVPGGSTAPDFPPAGGADRETGSRGDIVVLTLPANSAYLSVLRTATAGLAARLQFTLDEIEDLRIAVDEACAMLLAGGESLDAELICRFALTTDQITVTVSVPATGPILPSRDTFAWQVLTALAGAVEASVVNNQLTIQLTKQRGKTP